MIRVLSSKKISYTGGVSKAYMEDSIRKAGGATNFEAIITSEYRYTDSFKLSLYLYFKRGCNRFENVNPDEVNALQGLTDSSSHDSTSSNTKVYISSIDTNGNGQVTIKEAKATVFSIQLPVIIVISIYGR